MLEKKECPKCKKLISIKDTECPYCGIILNKYTNLKPSKSFYSASYKDVSIAEKLKAELKQYYSLSMIEKTQLIAKAKKYNFLDLASYYINLNSKNNDITIDNQLIFNLSKLNLKNKKSYYRNFSKPLLFSISILIAIVLVFIFLFFLPV